MFPDMSRSPARRARSNETGRRKRDPNSSPPRSGAVARKNVGTTNAAGAKRSRAQRLSVDSQGVVAAAAQVPSPNCDDRPADSAISLIVVHGISLPPGTFGGTGIVELFTNRLVAASDPSYAAIAHLRVSSHFLIRRDGALLQFVACGQRAWHAGVSQWRGRERCNDYSVGIELEGTDTTPYTTVQYSMLARLVKALRRRYPVEAIVGHSDVAPRRKTDPGPAFDWPRAIRLIEARRQR